MTRILFLPDDVPLNLVETSLSVEELRALLKSPASSILPEHSPALHRLTRRQRQVLHLLIQGHNPKSIARRMGISYRTVSHHIQRLRQDLNISNPLSALLSTFIASGKLDSPNKSEGENK